MKTLLIEIGTEELPPTRLASLAESFKTSMQHLMQQAGFTFDGIKSYATPRRIAVELKNCSLKQPDQTVEKKGPAIQAAFNAAGEPTKAALGWATANKISVAEAQRKKTDKGEWLLHLSHVKGKTLFEEMPDMVSQALKKLPIPKPMRWGTETVSFIRPIHTLTMLYGSDLIEGCVLGVKSSRQILGHRFMGQAEIELMDADAYETTLETIGRVIPDFAKRQAMIKDGLQKHQVELEGIVDLDPNLLDEVTALVEYPEVMVANFDAAFLSVPSEALIYTMKKDQKYFPVYQADQQLMPKFLFVSNIVSTDPVQVIQGNERVIRPRLADAQFFFEQDKQKTLFSRCERLAQITFQKKLGDMLQRTKRIATLSASIADLLQSNADHAYRAGLLSKADLTTQMVLEFPEVQGIMGMHYARLDGEEEAVALAIAEQYLPKFAGDRVPQVSTSVAVALAEKLDTLVGIFGIHQAPKADKDPFALRRAAIGILRILIENQLNLDTKQLVALACDAYGTRIENAHTTTEVFEFILARFKTWYQEQGIPTDVIQSVLIQKPSLAFDLDKRIHAIDQFRHSESAAALASANKRVNNILAKASKSCHSATEVDPSLFEHEVEHQLLAALNQSDHAMQEMLQSHDYTRALSELATLRQPVDHFFADVMVLSENAQVQHNRLALLQRLKMKFSKVADISLLQF
jgi:glycyl-tRNA synthetase beta chain